MSKQRGMRFNTFHLSVLNVYREQVEAPQATSSE